MRALSLDEMTDRSDVVVSGTVVRFRGCALPTSFTTEIELRVEGVHKNARAVDSADTVTITVPGGIVGDLQEGAGFSPEFDAGERVVLFARNEPGLELTPTAGFQGKQSIDSGGKVGATRLSEPQFSAMVRKAALGRVPPGEDPLGGSPIVEQAFQTYDDARWAIVDQPLDAFVNPHSGRPAQLTAHDVRLASIGAQHAWQNVAGSFISFNEFAETTRVGSNGSCESADYMVDTSWGITSPHAPEVLARAGWCQQLTVPPRFKNGDVQVDNQFWGPSWVMNPTGVCGGNPDLQTVLLHEYGHILGLSHPSANGCAGGSSGECPVMDATYGGAQRTPCADDAAGAAFLYPVGAGPPALPTNVTAISGSSGVSLSWTGVSSEIGYEVWRAVESCATVTAQDFVLWDTRSANITSYLDDEYGTGLTPSQDYCYRVRAFNTNGESPFSTSVEGSGPCFPASDPPGDCDSDGVANSTDNCPLVFNPGGQSADSDGDQAGDSCDTPGSGNVDCDHAINSVDSLKTLRYSSSLSVVQDDPCTNIGSGPLTSGWDQGDVNCSDSVNSVDALLILRAVAGLPVIIPGGCPIIKP
jgi:hypothetical protein